MKPEQLHSYTQDLIAQATALENNLIDLATYSNGSFTYHDLLQMPIGQVKRLQEVITKKLKQEKGIKESNML